MITDAATRTSPTVRTVTSIHRRTLARWKVAWAELGYDRAPSLDHFEDELIRLGGGRKGAEAQNVEERLRAAEAWENAGATIDRPMILVEPRDWLPEDELDALLSTLPAGAEVIVVTR